jgi:hypothetical protein
MSFNQRLAVILTVLGLYFGFLFQLALFSGPNRAQKDRCNQTCAAFGGKGSVLTHSLFFFQRRDGKCSCTIPDVQTIDRSGVPVSR